MGRAKRFVSINKGNMPGPSDYSGDAALHRSMQEDLLKTKRLSIGKAERRLHLVSNRFINVGPGSYASTKENNTRVPAYTLSRVLGLVRIGYEDEEIA